MLSDPKVEGTSGSPYQVAPADGLPLDLQKVKFAQVGSGHRDN